MINTQLTLNDQVNASKQKQKNKQNFNKLKHILNMDEFDYNLPTIN